MADKIFTLVIKVNPACCHCFRKLKKLLCKLQEREKIQKIEYDEKNNTIKISGPFDAEALKKKLLCMACCCLDIEIIPPKKPDPKPDPKPTTPPPPCPPKVVCIFPPWPCPPHPQCPPPPPPPEPKEKPPPPPPPPPVAPPPPCPWPSCCWQPCPCPLPRPDHRGGPGCYRCCTCGKEDSGSWPLPSCGRCGGAGGCTWRCKVVTPPSCGHCGGAGGCHRCSGGGCKIVCEEDSGSICPTM